MVHSILMASYRPNVAAIIQRLDGLILICERIDYPGSWQFPQGGKKSFESKRQALSREVEEEVGLRPDFYTVEREQGPYRYNYPIRRGRRRYDGQEQTYFLLRLKSVEAENEIDVESASDQEFRAFRWINPGEFQLEWLPPIKQEVYASVFQDFFGIPLR